MYNTRLIGEKELIERYVEAVVTMEQATRDRKGLDVDVKERLDVCFNRRRVDDVDLLANVKPVSLSEQEFIDFHVEPTLARMSKTLEK